MLFIFVVLLYIDIIYHPSLVFCVWQTMNESSWPSNVSDAGMLLTARTSVPCHEHWRQFPPPRPEVHYVVGTLLVLIGTTGALGNSLVLFVFTRYVGR
jgi:hypothetical protein